MRHRVRTRREVLTAAATNRSLRSAGKSIGYEPSYLRKRLLAEGAQVTRVDGITFLIVKARP